MKLPGALLCAAVLPALLSGQRLMAQGQLQGQPQVQQSPADVPTFRVTSSLVFLDVTVVDKKGRPVVTGLGKDDFTITENKKPQRIFSFEAPAMHAMNSGPDDKAPVTIFVLDLLNSEFSDFAFIRYSVHRYLDGQPELLTMPAEMMVISNNSLDIIQGYTRSKADLLFALDHLPPALPYKMMNASFFGERFMQSIDALQQIALQSQGVPGRKNVIWVGHGGPNLTTAPLTWLAIDELNRYVHYTANLLVDARISLFVIYPGLKAQTRGTSISALSANVDLGDGDPFSGDINFGLFVNETGGKLYFNRNDVDAEIANSQKLGSEYYTLTYQPQEGELNGKFRRIRVTLRNPNLRAVTKTGYFAPDKKDAPRDSRQQTVLNLATAARSTIPYTTLEMKVADVIRHPDTRSTSFTVLLKGKNLDWQPAENGKRAAVVNFAAVSLNGYKDILASRLSRLTVFTTQLDTARAAETQMAVKITVPLPRKTQTVRVVMETQEGGRIGTVDLQRKAIDAAPEAPTPEPSLVQHAGHE